MTWQPPSRKNWVAHFNVLGSNLCDGGRSVVPLDADRMLDDARRSTGLDDFGDDWFQEPYRVLVRAHDYSFADTGLDLEKERLRYADYQERFDVQSEVR